MTTTVQKQRETVYARKTAELLQRSWQVEASPNEINWPDLIVTEANNTFGLEVREVYLDETTEGSPKKANEVYNRKSIKNLAKAYYKRSRVPIKLNFLGDVGIEQDLSHLLAKEAGELCVWEQKRLEVYDGCVAYITRLPEQFQDYSRWSIVSDKVGWVATIDQMILEKVITKKAENLEKYKKQLADVRLLIVSDKIYNSGKARLMAPIKCQAHGFNAVYYLSFPDTVWHIAR